MQNDVYFKTNENMVCLPSILSSMEEILRKLEHRWKDWMKEGMMSRERDKQKTGKYEGTLIRQNIHISWNLIPSGTLKNTCCITKSS